TDGNLIGSIVDGSGGSIANAEVKITNPITGLERAAKSGANGEYRFNNIPVGSYDLFVTANGFAGATQKGVAVELNKTATVNVTVQVAGVATTMQVNDAIASIDTTTAQVQTSYTALQAKDLPSTSTGYGVLNLSLLSAGVASSGGLGYGAGPSVGGQRP